MKIKNTLLSFLTVIITVLTFSTVATNVHADSNPLAGGDPKVINTILNNFNANLPNRYLMYDPNPYMSNANYKKGTKVIYTCGNTTLQFTQFPTNETDTQYGTRVITGIANCTVIKKKLSNWGIVYYQVKFNNHKKAYWVLAADLHLQKNPNKNNTNVTDSDNQNVGLNYINYVRDQHGQNPLTWNDHLYTLAQERNQENINTWETNGTQSHYNADGSWKVDQLIQQHGWNDYVIGENISNTYSSDTPQTTIVNMINELTYNDSVEENWGHRQNILRSDATQMATATTYANGKYFQTTLFE